MRSLAALVLGACLCAQGVGRAQGRDPISGVVADVRVASAKLPTEPGWTPVLPTGTLVPSRGLGLDVGAHVYAGRLGPARLGLGGSLLIARGTAAPAETVSNVIEVATRFTALAPQLSFNFGHRLGWSYISGGVGPVKVTSAATPSATPGTTVAVDAPWSMAINYGGGARWFVTERVAAGIDLRWYRLGSRAAVGARPEAPGTTKLVIGGGIAFR